MATGLGSYPKPSFSRASGKEKLIQQEIGQRKDVSSECWACPSKGPGSSGSMQL